jgi:hypothetical protein
MATLDADLTCIPGQYFACISLVGPECPQKNDKFGLKIRGAFSTREEAATHAKRLQREDATFDIYVVDMYKWLLIPPDRDLIDDVHYQDAKLEEIMTKYRENQSAAASMSAAGASQRRWWTCAGALRRCPQRCLLCAQSRAL